MPQASAGVSWPARAAICRRRRGKKMATSEGKRKIEDGDASSSKKGKGTSDQFVQVYEGYEKNDPDTGLLSLDCNFTFLR